MRFLTNSAELAKGATRHSVQADSSTNVALTAAERGHQGRRAVGTNHETSWRAQRGKCTGGQGGHPPQGRRHNCLKNATQSCVRRHTQPTPPNPRCQFCPSGGRDQHQERTATQTEGSCTPHQCTLLQASFARTECELRQQSITRMNDVPKRVW